MSSFTDLVNEHEQAWGEVQYPGRPPIAHINTARVVAFWADATAAHPTITCHQDATEIRDYFDMLTRRLVVGFPHRRLIRVFVDGQEVRIKLKVGFEWAE